VAVWELVFRLPGAEDKSKEKFELSEMQRQHWERSKKLAADKKLSGRQLKNKSEIQPMLQLSAHIATMLLLAVVSQFYFFFLDLGDIFSNLI
jgi:hypothetical protein